MGWKIYFWFITLIMFAITGLLLADSLGILSSDGGEPIFDEIWTWVDSLSILIAWIGLVGLFGFAFEKIIGEQVFWQRWFIFDLIFYVAYTVYEYTPEVFTVEELWVDLAAYSIDVPYYIALYLYGYKSDTLWNPRPTPAQ